MKKTLLLLVTCLLLTPAAQAQDATMASSLQQQITDGINNGTLSPTEIAALQARQQQARTGIAAPYATPGIPENRETNPYGTPTQVQNNNSPINRRTTTGPDPFTYNSLGPDAYQAQKYKNPGYNVPAYPTTDPQSLNTQQQFTGPTAGTPYGSGYAQAPFAGTTTGGNGVYVYRPNSSR